MTDWIYISSVNSLVSNSVSSPLSALISLAPSYWEWVRCDLHMLVALNGGALEARNNLFGLLQALWQAHRLFDSVFLTDLID